ncbi:MAG: polysaccharide biosynthesis tyrosine autokinase [Longimicrobiales bacterium]
MARYPWVIAAFVGVGIAISALAFWIREPEFVAQGAVWVDQVPEREGLLSMVTAPQSSRSWVELLRSWTVLDSVAIDAGLFVGRHPDVPEGVFDGLRTLGAVQAGSFGLLIRGDSIMLDEARTEVIQRSAVGEPLGTPLGLSWIPDPADLTPGFRVPFNVMTIRDAAGTLGDRLNTDVMENGSIIRVELAGRDPVETAGLVNAIMTRTVRVAASLKRAQVDERTEILALRLDSVEVELTAAEQDLRSFQEATATLASNPGGAQGPDSEPSEGVLLARYFGLREELTSLRRDRERLVGAIADIDEAGVPIEVMERVPTARESLELSTALRDLAEARAEIRGLQLSHEDGDSAIVAARRRARSLETETIPSITDKVLSELSQRETQTRGLVWRASSELGEIPSRSAEEARLLRRFQRADRLHSSVSQRYEEARLAAASSLPDIRILDRAVPPTAPDARGFLVTLLGVLGLSAAFGVLAAIVADRADPEIRGSGDLGKLRLRSLGRIPAIGADGRESGNGAVSKQREAFRDTRSHLRRAMGPGPLCLAVTSPGGGDGKSVVSTNLALAFAELGRDVLLIDADMRRGGLHAAVDARPGPGLTDVLRGHDTLETAIQELGFGSLAVLSRGSRTTDPAVLLSGSSMAELLREARDMYGVVIVDCPSLDTSADGGVLCALTGSVMLVLRSGMTNPRDVSACLARLERLPTRVIGAVVNDGQQGRIERSFTPPQAPVARST